MVSSLAIKTRLRPIKLNLQNFISLLVSLFFVFEVFQGILRWLFASANLEVITHLPKTLMFICIFLLPLLKPKVNRVALIITVLFLAYTVWGIINLENVVQGLFGLWILAPFVFSLWVAPHISLKSYKNLFLLLFFASAIGVFLNLFFTFPWVGLETEIAGYSIEISRYWTAFGTERYAGFSRASYTAASQILIFGSYLASFTKNKLVIFFVWIISVLAIYLTTTKGMIAAWFIVSLYFFSYFISKYALKKYITVIWVGILVSLTSIMTLLPLFTIVKRFQLNLNDYISIFVFYSFDARLTQTWPDAFKLLNIGLESPFLFLTGRGIGGISTSQKFFESQYYSPSDNLFVYLAITFGLPLTFGLIYFIVYRLIKLLNCFYLENYRIIFLSFVICFTYGLVSGVIEEPVLGFVFGISLHRLFLDEKKLRLINL